MATDHDARILEIANRIAPLKIRMEGLRKAFVGATVEAARGSWLPDAILTHLSENAELAQRAGADAVRGLKAAVNAYLLNELPASVENHVGAGSLWAHDDAYTNRDSYTADWRYDTVRSGSSNRRLPEELNDAVQVVTTGRIARLLIDAGLSERGHARTFSARMPASQSMFDCLEQYAPLAKELAEDQRVLEVAKHDKAAAEVTKVWDEA